MSRELSPTAFCTSRTSLVPGSGTRIASTLSTSGPPGLCILTARVLSGSRERARCFWPYIVVKMRVNWRSRVWIAP